jgi:hypothetical protein
MDANVKASILHDVVRRMGGDGAEITTPEWVDFVKAQNDTYQTGPDAGEKVPSFTLADQNGAMRSLDDLMGDNGLLLVFSRSAGW